MQIGVDSFGAVISDPATGLTFSPVQRMQNLLEEIELADQVGLDVFGIGEHHRAEFLDSAPAVILGAAAARTKTIRLTSAVTVLSAADPVRVFQGICPLWTLSRMVVLRSSPVVSRSWSPTRCSVSSLKTTTRFSQKNWIYC
jgi:Luciferase-like monooxygenase